MASTVVRLQRSFGLYESWKYNLCLQVTREKDTFYQNAAAETKQKLLHCHLLQDRVAVHLREQ